MVTASRASADLFRNLFPLSFNQENQEDAVFSALQEPYSPPLISDDDFSFVFEPEVLEGFFSDDLQKKETHEEQGDLSKKIFQNRNDYSKTYPKEVVEMVTRLVVEMKVTPNRKNIGWMSIAKKINELFSLTVTNEEVRFIYERKTRTLHNRNSKFNPKLFDNVSHKNPSRKKNQEEQEDLRERTFQKVKVHSEKYPKEAVEMIVQIVDAMKANRNRRYIGWVSIAKKINELFSLTVTNEGVRVLYEEATFLSASALYNRNPRTSPKETVGK